MTTGHFTENIVHFVRVLRAAGIPVGPERTVAALDAVNAVGISRREDFRAALAAVLITRQEHQAVFDQAFDVFWRNPRMLEKLIASLLPKAFGRGVPERGLSARVAQALLQPALEQRR